MLTIQLGFVLPSQGRDKQHRPTQVEDLNRALDLVAGHFDSAWMVDHLQFGDSDMLEGFTALTYLSALHPRLRFGHAVLCQSFRNPALLAKMTATLQFMSGGRFILGLGAGWHEEEYKAYDYDFPPAPVRVEQLAETIQIIRQMWSPGDDHF
jgi:alkanesulfonate monooxygenase SsuD/methylene tetrahydromethanopterin reductase-like flavin-dependent oxidoreductase (luciferase family)